MSPHMYALGSLTTAMDIEAYLASSSLITSSRSPLTVSTGAFPEAFEPMSESTLAAPFLAVGSVGDALRLAGGRGVALVPAAQAAAGPARRAAARWPC